MTCLPYLGLRAPPGLDALGRPCHALHLPAVTHRRQQADLAPSHHLDAEAGVAERGLGSPEQVEHDELELVQAAPAPERPVVDVEAACERRILADPTVVAGGDPPPVPDRGA